MTPDALADSLRKAIDTKQPARIYTDRDSIQLGNDFTTISGRVYPVTYVRVRDDGMVEAGGEYEDWTLDPGRVFGVLVFSEPYPEWKKDDKQTGEYR